VLVSPRSGSETAGEQRKRDRVAVANEERRRLAILRSQQDLSPALHQIQCIGKICRDCWKRQQKSCVAAAEYRKSRYARKSFGAEKLAEDRQRTGQVRGFSKSANIIGSDKKCLGRGRRRNAQLLRLVAVHLEQLHLQHHFTARALELPDEFTCDSQPF